MELPTIEALPTITEARMTISRRGECRLGLFAGELLAFHATCHASETDRLRALLGAVERIVAGQHAAQDEAGARPA